MNKNSRNAWIDFCRGVLIIFVVAGHFCIKFITENDLQMQISNAISYFIYSFHMPAFFLLSGYVFREFVAPKVHAMSFGRFVADKAIGYGIPYAAFSLIYGTMKLIGGDYAINPIDVSSVLLFPIKPMGYLWFLYALLLLNILSYVVERTGINRYLHVSIFAVLFVCSAFFHSAWLGIFRACRFGVFFAIGDGFANELVRRNDLKRRNLIIPVFVFLLLEVFYLFWLQESGYLLQTFDEEPRYLFLWFALAICGGYICIGICRDCTRNISQKNWISYIGRNSIVLYLTHQITISVLRTVLIRLDFTGALLQILCVFGGSLLAGLFSIIMAERFPVFCFVFYAKKVIQKWMNSGE